MKMMAKIMIVALMFSSGVAKADVLEYLKDYGLPCAAGLAAGYLASKDHGGAIGLGVCVGVGTATYLQSSKAAQKMKDEDFKEFVKLMDSRSEAAAEKQDAKVSKAIKDMEEKNKSEVAALRQVMKEVVAERITNVSEESKAEMKRYIERADFMQDLEKRVTMKMREEVQVESKLRQKEVVDKCVDEALRELVLKKVGTPAQ